MDIEWFTTETHVLRKEDLEEFLLKQGCRRISIGAFFNAIDSNGFPNEMVYMTNFSFLQDKEWMTFEGYFRDMSKYDASIPPTAKFTFLFNDPAIL